MTIGRAYAMLCVVLMGLTLVTFRFAGTWWGIAASVASIILIAAVIHIGRYCSQRIEQYFKTF